MDTLRVTMMRTHLSAYREAMRVLAAHFTSVSERKAAIDIRDEFQAIAPAYVNQLIAGFDLLVAYTDGEECADSDSCNQSHGGPAWLCSRCENAADRAGLELSAWLRQLALRAAGVLPG